MIPADLSAILHPNQAWLTSPKTPVTSTKSAEFRRKKNSTWKTIGTSAPTNADQAAVDAILASAAAESSLAQAEALEDEQPQMLESGAHAGLQSAASVTAQLERRKRAEMLDAAATAGQGGGETIYRDASGRIINIGMKRAEARREAEEKERKEKEELEAMKGDVQLAEREKRREQLEGAKYLTVARGKDDVEMNEELKERQRWGDPMAGYATPKTTAAGAAGKGKGGKKVYAGAAEPNRYGIRPGWRWDGVDRGNGFERDWFKARNRKENLKSLEYQWQMDE